MNLMSKSRQTAPAKVFAKRLASTLLVGAAVAAGSVASASELTDHRGYKSCVNAFDTSNLTGVTYPRIYYIGHRAESKTYYVNASAWENGARVGKRLTCETSANGRQVLSLEADSGRFALAPNSNSGTGLSVAER